MNRRRLLAYGGAMVSAAMSGCLSEFGQIGSERSSPDHDGWPMAGYDAGNTGHHRTASLPSAGPEQLWTKQIGDIDQLTMPLVADQQVYVGSTTLRNPPAHLYQLKAASGDVAHKTSVGFLGDGDSPAIADGMIYTNTSPPSGTIAIEAFDTTDNSQQWQFELDGLLHAPLVVARDGLCVTTGSELLVLNREDGTERWRESVSQRIQPAVGNSAVHIMADGSIHAYDWMSGEQQWMYELTDRGSLAPVVRHGRVYAGDGTDVIALEDGEEVWRTSIRDLDLHEHELIVESSDDPEDLRLLGRTLAVDDTQVYVGRIAFLHALDAETGAGQWTTAIPEMEPADNHIRSPLTVADNILLVPLPDMIGAVDTADGSIQWTVEGPRSPVGRFAISDGRLFAAGTDRDLYAYGHPSDPD